MNYPKISLILFLGGIGIFFEYGTTVEVSIIPIEILAKWFCLYFLAILFIVYTIKDLKVYRETGLLKSFVYTALSLSFILIILGHKYLRYQDDQSDSLVKIVYDFKKNGHESIYLDFKKNGHLRIQAIYKFSETYYWGSYTRAGDTLLLDIPKHTDIGHKAVFTKDTLYFIGDSTRYVITDFYPDYN